MAEGSKDPNVIVKIGFLNDHIQENISHYKVREKRTKRSIKFKSNHSSFPFQEAFDVIILNDGSFDWVNDLLIDIVARNDVPKRE
jgi:hypothetical protein